MRSRHDPAKRQADARGRAYPPERGPAGPSGGPSFAGNARRFPSRYSGRQNPALRCLQIEVARVEMGVLLLIAGGRPRLHRGALPPEKVG
jgi:hypothetical protein